MSNTMQGKVRPMMVRAELMGAHTHATVNGAQVHVWQRGQKYLARGRYQGQAFGETIGETEKEAASRLRLLLTEIENGSYVRPSDGRERVLSNGRAPKLTLRQLIAEFLAEKRKLRGEQTAGDYKSRLMPVLKFAEVPESTKRWPFAHNIDRDFVVGLRSFLFQYQTTRNGRINGEPKAMSHRQVCNVLECLRTLVRWACTPAVQKLPAGWTTPLTDDLIGAAPPKDPFREDKLPQEARVKLARAMDRWQLCQLALLMVLPMRPDEAAGLLVSDVNLDRGWLEFGQRFTDCNFTKARTAFRLPFPEELRPILQACIADRTEGPLLRSRSAFGATGRGVSSQEELRQLFEERLRQESGRVQTAHDRKLLFRRLLRELGGVSEDAMNREFKALLAEVGIGNGATLYTLRSSVTTAMKNAHLPHLELRYFTSHSTSDILNEYASLDAVGAMEKYCDTIRPLLIAIADRARELGIKSERPAEVAESWNWSIEDRIAL
jgi:integrase